MVSAWLAKDSYFTAPEALAAGLVDVITEAPPAAVADAARPEGQESGPTEDEAFFHSVLSAMGDIEVRSKAESSRALNAWVVHRVRAALPDRPAAAAVASPARGKRLIALEQATAQ